MGKVEAGRPLRELGFVMRAFSLPGEGRALGMYLGDAPKGTEKLPPRKVERRGGRGGQRNPFGKLSPAHVAVLVDALMAAPRSDERDKAPGAPARQGRLTRAKPSRNAEVAAVRVAAALSVAPPSSPRGARVKGHNRAPAWAVAPQRTGPGQRTPVGFRAPSPTGGEHAAMAPPAGMHVLEAQKHQPLGAVRGRQRRARDESCPRRGARAAPRSGARTRRALHVEQAHGGSEERGGGSLGSLRPAMPGTRVASSQAARMKKRPTPSRCYETGDQMKPRRSRLGSHGGTGGAHVRGARCTACIGTLPGHNQDVHGRKPVRRRLGADRSQSHHWRAGRDSVYQCHRPQRPGLRGVARRAAGQLAARYSLQKWNGSNWYTCRSTPFVFNDGRYLNVIASNPHGAAPCGRGHYRTLGESLAWNGSTWEGGTTASPSHPPVP